MAHAGGPKRKQPGPPPVGAYPAKPPHLSPEAGAVWDRLEPILAGRVGEADAYLLERYAVTFALWRAAVDSGANARVVCSLCVRCSRLEKMLGLVPERRKPPAPKDGDWLLRFCAESRSELSPNARDRR